jgi:anti-anti-sigma regulatory factor
MGRFGLKGSGPACSIYKERVTVLTFIRRSRSGGDVIAIEGSFDIADADRLRSIIDALNSTGPVTLDFHGVRSASDMAIAQLARGLVEASRRVSLAGLSEHHHRLLGYLGAATANVDSGPSAVTRG